MGTPGGGETSLTCRDLQHMEDAALAAFDRNVSDERLRQKARLQLLDGLQLYTHPLPCWEQPQYNRVVCGQTVCWAGIIQIGTPPAQQWHLSSFTHELAHWLQSCTAQGPRVESDDEAHNGWNRDGISAAIQEAQSWNF